MYCSLIIPILRIYNQKEKKSTAFAVDFFISMFD